MDRKTVRLILLLSIITSFSVGCAARPRIIHTNPSNPIRTVAILPVLNNSDDVDAPTRVREGFYNRLAKYHYTIQDLKKTNDTLNLQMGITMGRQLDMATAKQIGEKLGVDGVFYGYLLNFDEITIGVLNTYKVRMGWKLVNTKTGEISWGRGVGARRTQSIGGVARLSSSEAEEVGPLPGSKNPMGEMPGLNKWISMGNESVGLAGGLISGIGGKLISGIQGNSLEKEMNFAFDHLFPGILIGPGAQVSMASENETKPQQAIGQE